MTDLDGIVESFKLNIGQMADEILIDMLRLVRDELTVRLVKAELIHQGLSKIK